MCENRLNTSHLSLIIYPLTSDLTLTSSRGSRGNKEGMEDDVNRQRGMTEKRVAEKDRWKDI